MQAELIRAPSPRIVVADQGWFAAPQPTIEYVSRPVVVSCPHYSESQSFVWTYNEVDVWDQLVPVATVFTPVAAALSTICLHDKAINDDVFKPLQKSAQTWTFNHDLLSQQVSQAVTPVSYTHLTLPTIYSV